MPIVNAAIQLDHGLQANLPSTGLVGEPFFTEDEGNFYVWNGTEMVQINGGTSNAFEVNGSALASAGIVNFEGDGSTIAVSNPSAGNVKLTFIGTLAQTIAAVSHQFLTSYNSFTGTFTQAALVVGDIPSLSGIYDLAGAAATAQSNAEAYAASLASNYDSAGAAATAQSNAESFATSAVATETSRAETAEGLLVLKTTTVNGHALSSNVVVSASDLTTGTLPHAQLPTLLSGDIPNNAANTSGTAAGLSGSPNISITNLIVGGATSFVAGSIAYAALSGTPTIPTSFAWNVEGNATGNLSLSNAGYTSTFNQTSAVAWLWANTTTATSGTTNASPLLELAANYYTGSASAQDTWTIGSALAAGTNGKSILSITHSGSTANAYVAIANGYLTNNGQNFVLDVNYNGGGIIFTQQRGTTQVGGIGFGSGGGVEGVALYVTPLGGTVGMQSNYTSQSSATSGSSGILQHLGNNISSLTATSGTLVGVDIGSSNAVSGDSLPGMTFAATSTSSAVINGLRIAPTINVGAAVSWTGSATMLLVNPTLTATGSGTPTINLMDLQVGGVSKHRVDQTGAVFMAAASGAPSSAGTAGTAGEIIYYSGLLYFCSVTGAAGSATWNKLNLTAV